MFSTFRWIASLTAILATTAVVAFARPAYYVDCSMSHTFKPEPEREGCNFISSPVDDVKFPAHLQDYVVRKGQSDDVKYEINIWRSGVDQYNGLIKIAGQRGTGPQGAEYNAIGHVAGPINVLDSSCKVKPRPTKPVLELQGFNVGKRTHPNAPGCVFDHYFHVTCRLCNPDNE